MPVTSAGTEPTQCDRIFGRFERAVSERHYGGLGVGLYISRMRSSPSTRPSSR
jgi:signal transduction histidine kinase